MEKDNINDKHEINRRKFLKVLGGGTAAVTAATIYSCGKKDKASAGNAALGEVPTDKMTYRTNPKTKDKVSLLGYGFMRLPKIPKKDGNGDEIDQETVNKLTDYALAHGVNYFDTSPAYCEGLAERSMGIALKRHPRNKYFIATKLSNFDPKTWSREASLAMYHNSFKELQVDYLDYLLLHAIGMEGMDALHGRYLDNGILDFLLKERETGRIRNLGFSYHGDVKVFDYLLSTDIKWDFVQIQLNYVDWKHASEWNTNADYLYGELKKRNIPAVIMEPLLGGKLAQLDYKSIEILKRYDQEANPASWAFRFAGSPPDVLTVLSGMTYMEHLQDNIRTYSPLKPLTDKENEALEQVAQLYLSRPFVSCTACQYCMPCPYGLDIPGIFSHYNKCLNEGNYSDNVKDENYKKARRDFLIGYDRNVPRLRQANHCIGCGQCRPHCPQHINIPEEMQRIDKYVEQLKRNA